jgi:hypothetical protein
MVARPIWKAQDGMQRKPMRGQGSETVTVLPGPGVHEIAHQAELERWAWRRVATLRLFYTHLSMYVILNLIILLIDLRPPAKPGFTRYYSAGACSWACTPCTPLTWCPGQRLTGSGARWSV